MGRDITAAEFEELYRDTARDVFGFLRCRTTGDAEDLVAEVYAVAWRRRADLPAPMLRRAWLFRVAHNLLKADARRRRREGAVVDELAARPNGSGAAADGPPGTGRAAVITRAMDRLSPGEREVLRLVVWECLTPAELAVALDVRPGTARVRLHRARQAFASDPEVKALVGSVGCSVG